MSSRRSFKYIAAVVDRPSQIYFTPLCVPTSWGVTASNSSLLSTPAFSSWIGTSIRRIAISRSIHYWANQAQTQYSQQDVDQWIQEFSNLSQYETAELEKWRNAFDTYDHDNDGFISPADLQKNQNLSLQKVKLLKEADRDHNNLIDFGEFVSVISSLDIANIRCTYEGFGSVDIKLEFEKFAVQNTGGSKMVMHVPQLKQLMLHCDCVCVTDKDAERLFSDMDSAADGYVDLNEFTTWIKRPF